MEEPLQQRDLKDAGFSPQEIYVVTVMRMLSAPLRPDVTEKPYLCCEHLPVCSYDTLFGLLGKGILVRDEESTRMGHYFLTEEWR